jgi:hypothetical protein
MSLSLSPRASVKTASGLPRSFSELNTSHWTNGYRRPPAACTPLDAELSAADPATVFKNRLLPD